MEVGSSRSSPISSAGGPRDDERAEPTSPIAVVRRSDGWPRGVQVALIVLVVAALAVVGTTLVASRFFEGGPRVIVKHYLANAPPLNTTPVQIQTILAGVEPAVVALDVTKLTTTGTGTDATTSTIVDHATGMVISSRGELVTNAHAVVGAVAITATPTGSDIALPARVIGENDDADLALLQVRGPVRLPIVTFADTGSVRVGDSVVAVGFALGFPGDPTVTTGIVSALGRTLDIPRSDGEWPPRTLSGLIQTDAPITGGNSGGPLLNSSGLVIGMNTVVVSSGGDERNAEDIGFAISSDTIRALVPHLRR